MPRKSDETGLSCHPPPERRRLAVSGNRGDLVDLPAGASEIKNTIILGTELKHQAQTYLCKKIQISNFTVREAMTLKSVQTSQSLQVFKFH